MLTDLVRKKASEDFDPVVLIARLMCKERWMRVDKVLTGYTGAYDALFNCQKTRRRA